MKKIMVLILLTLVYTITYSDWYFRGTPNGFGTLQMTQIGTTLWKTTQDFTGQTSPRFKIDRLGNWAEAYPSADYVVKNLKYDIVFDSQTKVITVVQAGTTAFVNGTILQGFGWNLENNTDPAFSKYQYRDSSNAIRHDKYDLWKEYIDLAGYYSNLGVTAVWLPSASKAAQESASDIVLKGGNYNGYGIYDRYDLGEFMDGSSLKTGEVRTKWGTKTDYINAVSALHAKQIQVYAEVIMNHNIGGAHEIAWAESVNKTNTGSGNNDFANIKIESKFDYAVRNNTYSSFKWNSTHFNGSDRDYNYSGGINPSKGEVIYRWRAWTPDTDVAYQSSWRGNCDYLLGMNIDFSNTAAKNELKTWGQWFLNTTGVDGFRLDAIKHYSYAFQKDWITTLRANNPSKELFTVGEFWEDYFPNDNFDSSMTKKYMDATANTINVFDFPLGRHFRDASRGNGGYNMANIFNGTLVKANPYKAVTFVDNHDVEEYRNPGTGVQDWFKPIAYAMILLRQSGYPTLFYSDVWGRDNIASQKTMLERLMNVRKYYAYGTQTDYFDNADIVGWTRAGDTIHTKPIAVVVSDNGSGTKWMKTRVNKSYKDATGNRTDTIYTNASGYANFPVNGKSVSVWVEQ